MTLFRPRFYLTTATLSGPYEMPDGGEPRLHAPRPENMNTNLRTADSVVFRMLTNGIHESRTTSI